MNLITPIHLTKQLNSAAIDMQALGAAVKDVTIDLESALSQYTIDSYERDILAQLDEHIIKKSTDFDAEFGRYLITHQRHVAYHVQELLKSKEYSEDTIFKIGHAALNHDNGKLGQRPSLWIYTPEKRTEADKEERKYHGPLGPVVTRQAFEAIGVDLEAPKNANLHAHMQYCLDPIQITHHERQNGTGSLQMRAEQMCYIAQAFSVIDAISGKTLKDNSKTDNIAFEELLGDKHEGEFNHDVVRDVQAGWDKNQAAFEAKYNINPGLADKAFSR